MAETNKQLTTAQKKFVTYLKNQGRATATILAYGKDTEQLVEFLNKKQITQAGSVLSEHIEAFKEYLADNNYIAKSISRKLNSIKTFFRFLEEEKLVKDNPAATIPHPKYEVKPPRILSKTEYRALRDAARDDKRMAAVIEILLQTGIRISELGRLQLDDVANKEIQIRAYESHSERTVPLNQAAKNALDRYQNIRPKTRNKNVFVTKTGRPLLVRNIRAAIDRYFKIAGVEKVTVNDLRHTFISHQLVAGASVVLIQRLVGHKRLSTTEKYLELISDKVKETVKLEEL
jgi:site-specific recombinase XerD